MISRQELTELLDELLVPGDFSDYCDNGLQFEGKEGIARIGTAVTASEETIEAAMDAEVDALIVHHGLFWDRQRTRLVRGMLRRVKGLMVKGINLYCYHLPLDAHQQVGNNWTAARDLRVGELEPFCEYGVVGWHEPIKVSEWVKQLEEYYSAPAHVALGGPETVERVAICSGGSHRLLSEAIAADVECYITGTFDEPMWHQAHEEGVHFIALGHSATERVGPRALASYLSEQLPIPAEFLDLHNPF